MPFHLRLFKNWNWAYILGELALITVGVLFALAINNWNNQRAETKREGFHLQDLQQSLRSDLSELKVIVGFHEEARHSCMVLYKHFVAAAPWNDSFPEWISKTANAQIFFPQRAAFENLKSLDFNLIKNDQLRASIFQTYEERFAQLKASENILLKRIDEYWVPLLASKVRMMDNYQIEPFDYESIIKDPQYRNYLGMLYADHDRIVMVSKVTTMDVELLIRQIGLELEKIKAGKRRTQEPRDVTIRLVKFPDAKKIVLSGSFNEWHISKDTLQKTENGWQTTLHLKPGVYMYKFIVDGEWMEDPDNPEKVLSEYDNYNSILLVR